MREIFTSGSVRGLVGNHWFYSEKAFLGLLISAKNMNEEVHFNIRNNFGSQWYFENISIGGCPGID